jgi:energy-converting hydrogenase Eha subunit E
MDLSTLGFAMGSAWLSGINLYATVLTLGLLQRFHLANLPGDLGYLAHTWILILAGGLAAVQFIADKIPAVDSVWDVIHTFIRIPAGAIMAAAAFAHLDPSVRIAALLIGGGIALSSHSAKTATKLAANASPEPVSNVVLGLTSDAVTVGGSMLMASHPIAMISVVVVAVIFSVVLIRWIFRMMRRLFKPQPKESMA